jgi:hypothetical protein
MNNLQHEINRDNGLPVFHAPKSVSEARARIAELNSAIRSIDNQISVREISNNLDPEWLKRSTTSQNFKTLERDRLQNWIDDRNEVASRGKNINDYIVAIVREDYNDLEWMGVEREAREIMGLE